SPTRRRPRSPAAPCAAPWRGESTETRNRPAPAWVARPGATRPSRRRARLRRAARRARRRRLHARAESCCCSSCPLGMSSRDVLGREGATRFRFVVLSRDSPMAFTLAIVLFVVLWLGIFGLGVLVGRTIVA